MVEAPSVKPANVQALRDRRYRRRPELALDTIQDAKAHLSDVGFCFLFPIKGVEMPSLWDAVCGCTKPVPNAHRDPHLHKTWGWKDESLGKRRWYYGKLLRRRATLVSLDLLPAFYACSDNYGDLNDYLEEYQAGHLTVEAKWIYEALLEHGPLNTVRLRRETGMSAKTAQSRYARALTELQVGLKVLPVGVAKAGAWNYAFVYEIVQRHFPELPLSARGISRDRARQVLVSRYLDNVVVSDRATIGRVFHVLNWPSTELVETIGMLLRDNVIWEMDIEGMTQPQLVSRKALEVVG